jgi:hypothetical protein
VPSLLLLLLLLLLQRRALAVPPQQLVARGLLPAGRGPACSIGGAAGLLAAAAAAQRCDLHAGAPGCLPSLGLLLLLMPHPLALHCLAPLQALLCGFCC